MRMRTLMGLSLLLLVARGFTASGQGTALTGAVWSVRDEPLVGAQLELRESEAGVAAGWDVADRKGAYEMRGIAPGRYELSVRFVGFADVRIPITLVPDSTVVVDVRMNRAVHWLDPVVISASRIPEKALEAPASVSVLSARELERDAVPAPITTLRNVPGVDIQQHGINRYYLAVRGFNDNYTSHVHPMLDYRDMLGPGFSDAFYLRMPLQAMDFERVEVVRGPGSALYGPGVAQGVVHFITKDPFTYPGTSLMLEAGQQQTAGGAFRHAGVVSSRFAYKILGRYIRGEDWKFDPNDPHDALILGAEADRLTDLEGHDAGPLANRWYDVNAGYLGVEGRLRLRKATTLTGNAAYTWSKNSFNASGEWQWDGSPAAFAQVRLQSGRLFSQAFFQASLADEDYFNYRFNYRTGLLGFNKSSELGLQAQYGLDLPARLGDLVVGVDVQHAMPRTRGALTGRNEDKDTFYTLGGYLQSVSRLHERLDLTLSGRLDYFSPIEGLGVSPRAALVFRPTPQQNLRLTYNRAVGSLRGLAYFMDFITDDRGAFTVCLLGGASPFTFADPHPTSSFIVPPGFPVRDSGVGISLSRAYAAATAGLTAQNGPLSGASSELRQVLRDRTGQIGGFSDGLLSLGGEIVSEAVDRDPIGPSITNVIELGYKGFLAGRLLLEADAYYTRRERFGSFRLITPLVIVPTLGEDLGEAVHAAFTDEELEVFGLDVEALTDLYASAGEGLSANPVGIVEPEENFDASTRPELVLANGNFGQVDYFGVDLSVEGQIVPRLTGFLTTSWISDTYFDDEDLREPGSGFNVSMIVPRNRLKAGLGYDAPNGLNLRMAVRYVRSFEVDDDFYRGRVGAYTVVDLGAGFTLRQDDPGLLLALTAQNALNNRHREYIGVPVVGRLVTARITVSL